MEFGLSPWTTTSVENSTSGSVSNREQAASAASAARLAIDLRKLIRPHHEARPYRVRRVTACAQLGNSQGFGSASRFSIGGVELFHEACRRAVLDGPQGCDD